MIRFDDTTRILWIEAATPDAAWDLFHQNPILLDPEQVRGIAYYASTDQQTTGVISRRSDVLDFFRERKTNLNSIVEQIKEKQFVHILPFAVQTEKFQFKLTIPPSLWVFEVDAGQNHLEFAAEKVREIVPVLSPDDTLVGINQTQEPDGKHYHFLMVVGPEFEAPNAVWIERKQFKDWKWDPRVPQFLSDKNVQVLTKTSYEKLVDQMVDGSN